MDSFTTNEQIALELGWTHYLKHNQWYKWCPPGKSDNMRSYQSNAPDFEHDWAHAGPLQVEMVAAGISSAPYKVDDELGIFWAFPWYSGRSFKTQKRIDTKGDTLTQAISRAWLAWKKEEK